MVTQYVTLQDTGKRRTTSTSSEETDIANSGSVLTLKGVELSYDENSILNTSPSIGLLEGGVSTAKFSVGEVDKLGVKIPKWTARGVLNVNNSTDLATIKVLRDMIRTKGYKILKGDVPDYVDGTGDSTGVNVRVESLRLVHRSRASLIDYTVTMWETA